VKNYSGNSEEVVLLGRKQKRRSQMLWPFRGARLGLRCLRKRGFGTVKKMRFWASCRLPGSNRQTIWPCTLANRRAGSVQR